METNFPQKELQLLAEITLPFAEPSGIAFSETLQKMWVVSGGDQHVYMLDTAGKVERKLLYTGIDLEGIAFDVTDSTLWIVDEYTKEIVHLDLNGNVLFRKAESYSSKSNKGPEGITIGKDHIIYIINERDPSVLFELDSTYAIAQSYPLNFALDYSDVSYDQLTDTFWILSDETNAFFSWSKQHGVIIKYLLPNAKNEGIAFDRARNIFYIVNNDTAKLYFYR
ncbi:MAG: SdiA-regulated domain-containing protein [Ignavibacteriales bacterium]|nr:SdiA-regulated domain-containing protein [Ignavibacteriales bacterium]